jgi:GTP-binding protein
MKLAVVGKRNVGKSTFINCLAGEERMIVSEVPGTTRDAVDVRFEKDGRCFMAIDTAGVRKKSKMARNNIEFYSYTRVLRSIRRADVVFLFLDAIAEISQTDKKLARTIADNYMPCVIVVNKWDLAKDRTDTEIYADYIDKLMPQLDYAPISFVTASDGKNVQSLLDLARQLHKQVNTTVSTAQLNKAVKAITSERAPSVRRKVGLPKIYYGTQVADNPPTLLLFVNNPDFIDENYRRFLINRLRDLLPFSEVPIRLLLRHHHETKPESHET